MIPISKPIIGKQEINAVTNVLKSGMLATGPVTKLFEQQFAKLCGTKYAVAVNNGTAAIHTALHAVGIKTGDEVITTPFTFVATANTILMVGAKPIYVDIDEKTYNIDTDQIEKAITKKTKAILAVNLYGQPADYSKINAIAKKYKLLVVEDAAQSVRATQRNKTSGNLADIASFSLYATKNVMSGEGGVVTTNNEAWYKRMMEFRNHGQPAGKRYEYTGLGYNYRLTDVLAAIALEQLKRVESGTKKRQKTAALYNKAFRNIKGLITPAVSSDNTHVYHQYTLRITKDFKMSRDKLREYLLKHDIQTNIFYPIPMYQFKHLRFNHNPKNFPVTNKAVKEVLSIPVHPLLKESEIEYIIKTIKTI